MTIKLVRVNKIKGYRDQDNPFRYGGGYEQESAPETTTPVTINAAAIKSYYPRKEGRAGTRINFQLGNGFAIAERPHEFEALLVALGAEFVGDWNATPASDAAAGTTN